MLEKEWMAFLWPVIGIFIWVCKDFTEWKMVEKHVHFNYYMQSRGVVSTEIKVINVNWEPRGEGAILVWRAEEGFIEKAAFKLGFENWQGFFRHSEWKDYH